MAVITEQNCPTLRYLKWEKELWRHPEFLKWIRNAKSKYTPAPPPFLSTKYKHQITDIVNDIVNDWEYLSEQFRKDIWTVSVNYGKAFESATDSICKHRVELYKEMCGEHYSGACINATEYEPIAVLYDLNLHNIKKEKGQNGEDGFFVSWDGVILMITGTELMAVAVSDPETGEMKTEASNKVSEIFEKNNGSVDAGLIFSVMDSLVFRKYANVVIKDTKGKNKSVKDNDEDNVVVKTNIRSDIRQYDINWYTTTVRSAGFARKGYMAVRWKGHRGNQHPEIVPVKPAWVKGYVRKARKPYAGAELKDFENKQP